MTVYDASVYNCGFVFRAALYDGLSTPIFLEYKSIAQFAWHVMISVSDIFNITCK